jgi:CRP-like cAMP-binding protein
MFKSALQVTGTYSHEEVALFEKVAMLRHLTKNEVLQKEGETASSMFFVQKGALYQYQATDDQSNNIIELYTANEWLMNAHSFVSRQPAQTAIAAFSDSTLLEITIERIHYLIGRSPAFLQLNRVTATANSRVLFFDHSLTPAQKYQWILDSRPGLIRQFPLKMIASYLKITPETLSRVREKLVGRASTS